MAWYNASWLYRFKITTDETKVNEAIDNVFYNLANAPAAFWTHVKADGGDIRVTQADEVTEVARDVSGFDNSISVGSLFFKATGLSASVNTDYYVYYGNSGASEPAAGSTFGKNNVWTSYMGVFHLDEASGNAIDAKAGVTAVNTGFTMGNLGKLRTGATTNGSDFLDAGNNFGITAAALSITLWMNPTALGTFQMLVTKMSGSERNGYYFRIGNGTFLQFEIADASSSSVVGGAGAVLSASVFQHVAVTYDGSNVRFYVNGVAAGVTGETKVPTNSTNTFCMGNYSDAIDFFGFNGVLDEVRLSTSVRSANWMSTEVNNQNSPSTFWTTGAETQDAVVSSLLWLPRQMILRGPRGLMTPSGPVPPTRPEP